MSRTIRNLALAVMVAATTAPLSAQGQTLSDSPPQAPINALLRVTHPTLLASLQRIWRGSPLWREAVTTVRKSGRHVLVATPTDVTLTDRNRNGHAFDPQVLAEAFPVLDADAQIPIVVVVVNLRLVQEMHDARLSVRRDFDADLDRILVHEIYGHAVPYLLAGNLAGRCADPTPWGIRH